MYFISLCLALKYICSFKSKLYNEIIHFLNSFFLFDFFTTSIPSFFFFYFFCFLSLYFSKILILTLLYIYLLKILFILCFLANFAIIS